MTFIYSDYWTLRNEHGHKHIDCVYDITINGETITVNGKRMKVVDDSEFAYRLLKTQIKAIGGAQGLYDWIGRAQRYAEILVKEICDHIIRYGKENNKND